MPAKGQTTARRGRKDPSLLAPKAETSGSRPTNVYVCGNKPLRVGELTLTAGVEVPGAAHWLRKDAWVSARVIREVREGEDYTTFEDFAGQTHEDYLASVVHQRLVAAEQAKADRLAAAAAEAEEAQTAKE